MLKKIKNKVEKELKAYIGQSVNRSYGINYISPLLYRSIKDFASRTGKRVRPTLFVIGYLGFAKKEAPGLYKSAIALELFHDFMLIHDDIIDKSETRRGKPAMHAMLNKWLRGHKDAKFNGQDLAIVIGDILYAMAIDAFLSVKENMRHKEAALKKLIEAGVYTGSGEFIELIYGLKNIDKIARKDIFRVYDLKTANYTFASPLGMGAILAGAGTKEIKTLAGYGTYLGRAFQIKDDILGTFGQENKIGKSNLTDLQEGKRTILIWQAYQKASQKDKTTIKKLLSKKYVSRADLSLVREVIIRSGALEYAKKEVARLISKAERLLGKSRMHPSYKNLLDVYTRELLNL